MFTKESVLKAFIAINSSQILKEYMFENENFEESPEEQFRAFNEGLVSDELVDYINKNARELTTVEFGNYEKLGVLGSVVKEHDDNCRMTVGTDMHILPLLPAMFEKKAVRVGSDGVEGNINCNMSCVTYIFEDGTYAVIEETSYGLQFDEEDYEKDVPPLLLVRTVCKPDTATPSLDELDESGLFDEYYKGYWDN